MFSLRAVSVRTWLSVAFGLALLGANTAYTRCGSADNVAPAPVPVATVAASDTLSP